MSHYAVARIRALLLLLTFVPALLLAQNKTAYRYDAAGNLLQAADVTWDPNNCGSIGNVCGAPAVCCSGSCSDRLSDPFNCGACGVVCPPPPNGFASCSNTQCGFGGCNAGFSQCGANCVNTTSDPQNCGGCGVVCSSPANASPTCTNSSCGFSCNSGFQLCGGICRDAASFASDLNNCGSCGHSCPSDPNGTRTCSSGQCGIQCNANFVLCNGVCRPSSQFSICGGVCRSILTDPDNCGACGNRCTDAPTHARPICEAGGCSFACDVGYQPCGDVCIPVANWCP